MPTVTVQRSVTLHDAAEALHGELGIARKVTTAIAEAFAVHPGT